MLRFLTSGESHGPGLLAIVDGLPSGIAFEQTEIEAELGRRRLGHGRGPRMAIEADRVAILGGVRHGVTMGSPVGISIENSEFEEKWAEEMSPAPGSPKRRLTQPRPGHADLVGMLKYDLDDARSVLERASARETAARVGVGALCKAFLAHVDVSVVSHVVEIGGVAAKSGARPVPGDMTAVDASSVRCLDPGASEEMAREIEAARSAGDSVGGVFEVVAYGVLPGLGSHVQWDRKLDAALARAVMSINAIKAVEVGDGFAQARSRGSDAHDEILPARSGGARGALGIRRSGNRAGGIEGGMSTGEPIVVRAAMKPISTLAKPLRTVDLETGEGAEAFRERTDVCAVPAAAVVAESMVAFALAGEVLEKFGGDSVAQVTDGIAAYRRRLEARGP